MRRRGNGKPWRYSSLCRGTWQARVADRRHVPMIGSAAAAKHPHGWIPRSQLMVTLSKVGRIADVQFRRIVQLRMALGGCVGANAADAPYPVLVTRQCALEVGWMGAIDHVVDRRPTARLIRLLDRFAKG